MADRAAADMLIIIDDDATYVSWIGRHRQGFVVDARHKPTKNHMILHRAICSEVKPHKRARLTTGGHIKACSLDLAELKAWAQEQTSGGLSPCAECRPEDEEQGETNQHAASATTRLGREALSYVLDLAVMRLDGETPGYRATLEDVAEYLDKTAAQLAPAVERLIGAGYLECDEPVGKSLLAATTVIYPTAIALRTIPAFAAMTSHAAAAELDQLKTH